MNEDPLPQVSRNCESRGEWNRSGATADSVGRLAWFVFRNAVGREIEEEVRMSKVAELMVTEAVTAQVDETVVAVAKRMAGNDVGAVIVVAGGDLVGVFSERDLAVRVVAEGRDPAATRVADVATTGVVSVGPDDGIRAALAKLREGKFRHLPVVEDGKPIGILSTRDLMAAAIGKLESYIEQAAFEREAAGGGDPYDHFGGGYGK